MQVGGPQQVMLGVTVAEIARSLSRALTVDFSAFGGGGDITGGALGAGSVIQGLKTAAMATNPATLFFNFIGRDATVQTVINAARDNGLAKVLAEPNLTTISGQDAEFVSGGEFPVPVPQYGAIGGTGGGITVVYKEYGVILKFIPVVLNSGRISLKLNIAVSEIDPSHTISLPSGTNGTYVIPALTKRNASSAMELDDGQTLGIAGLINDTMRETVSKFPGLGDIPILGQLFTSQSYLKNETELMIFVTPRLVKPMDANKIRLPTDAVTDPSDLEFFIQGKTEGDALPPQRKPGDTTRYGGGMRGHFGQEFQEAP
jgi:pilus assembly protein CpaC